MPRNKKMPILSVSPTKNNGIAENFGIIILLLLTSSGRIYIIDINFTT